MRSVGFPAVRYAEGPPASGWKPHPRLYAVVLVGVVLLAAIAIAYYEYDVVNPNSTSTPASSPRVAIVTDCKLGISLRLAVKEVTLSVGGNQTFYLSVENDFNKANNVTYTGPSFAFFAVGETVFLLVHLNGGCQPPFPPAFILIYNATSGKLLQLNTHSPDIRTCVGHVPAFHFTANQNLTGSFSIGGYYTSINLSEPWLNAAYHVLPQGRYSAVAFDSWKQTAELNFTVVH